jgi:hypothetical protein
MLLLQTGSHAGKIKGVNGTLHKVFQPINKSDYIATSKTRSTIKEHPLERALLSGVQKVVCPTKDKIFFLPRNQT